MARFSPDTARWLDLEMRCVSELCGWDERRGISRRMGWDDGRIGARFYT